MRKAISLFIFIVLAVSMCLTGCGSNNELKTISIDNKTELQAEWYAGDADRSVELSFSPSSFTIDNTRYIVSSSDMGVIAVNGNSLKAVGGGTAVITATVDGKSDSVEITVKSVLKGVKIVNKNSLKKTWLVGDDDRTVDLAFAPDTYIDANAEAVISSSDSSVIEVSGKTLKAKQIGKATITVTVGEFTDAVELTVRPELQSVAIANKEQLTENFGLGQTKKLELTFSPAEYYNSENTDVDVVSTATDKVVANGLNLRSVGLGQSVITVKVGELNDTVNVEVTILNEQPKQARVVILCGQSNAVGYSYHEYLTNTEYEKALLGYPNIFINRNGEGCGNAPDNSFSGVSLGMGRSSECFGPELGMAKRFTEELYDGETYIIKFGVGGTALDPRNGDGYANEVGIPERYWNAPSESLDGCSQAGTLYVSLCENIDAALETLIDNNLSPKIEALCWMQGESEAYNYYDRYFDLEKEFILSLRKKYAEYCDDDGMAFVSGGISSAWTHYIEVNKSKKDVCASIGNAVFIDTVDMGIDYSKEPYGAPDNAHFDATSMMRLGEAFANAVMKYFN